jgi:hypothetical protein
VEQILEMPKPMREEMNAKMDTKQAKVTKQEEMLARM